MSRVILLLGILLGIGCSFGPKKDTSGLPLEQSQRVTQENELRRAQTELGDFKFEKALELFQKFQNDHLNSPYQFQAALGEAKSLEGLARWSEAVAVYRRVIEAARQTQPELVAQALYQVSFCYESLGDETKAHAALVDADGMKEKLPEEIAKAELPVRIAAILHRMGQSKASADKLREAELGLQELKAKKDPNTSTEWLARTYFQMGLLSTQQLSLENYQASLDTLKIVQIFSLRAVEENDPKWSALAAETLANTYRDLANLVDQVPVNRALEKGVGLREQRDIKNKMAGQILESIEKLKSLRLTAEQETESIVRMYSALFPVEKKLVTVLESNPLQNELTPESAKFQGLKKNILMKAQPTFPAEKAAVPLEKSEDRK